MTSMLVAATILTPALVIQTAGAPVDVRKATTLIERARDLLTPSARPTRTEAGLASLVEALAELSAGVDAAPAFRANVLAARAALRGRATDDKAVTALRDAHKVLHGGAGVAALPPGTDLAALTAAIQDKLATARRLLDDGQVDASARTLLEAVLMIVTPVAPGGY